MSATLLQQASDVLEALSPSKGSELFADTAERCHRFIEQWDLQFAEITNRLPNGYISPNSNIHPTAIIGPQVFIFDDVYVGPYCYLKSKVILCNSVKVGFNVELDRIIINSGTKISHTACLGRSVIGRNCNLGFGFANATRNLRGNVIKVWPYHDRFWVSSASHHGAVLGDCVQAGISVATMPGSSIEHDCVLFPQTQPRKYIQCQE